MGVGLLLMQVLFHELFGSFECILILFPLGLEGEFVPDLVIDGGLIFFPLAHDIGHDILLSGLGESYSGRFSIVDD